MSVVGAVSGSAPSPGMYHPKINCPLNCTISTGAGQDLGWLPRPGLSPFRGASREGLERGGELLCARGHPARWSAQAGERDPLAAKSVCVRARSPESRTIPVLEGRWALWEEGGGSGRVLVPLGLRLRQLENLKTRQTSPPEKSKATGACCGDRVWCREVPLTRSARSRWTCPDSERAGRRERARRWNMSFVRHERYTVLSKVGNKRRSISMPRFFFLDASSEYTYLTLKLFTRRDGEKTPPPPNHMQDSWMVCVGGAGSWCTVSTEKMEQVAKLVKFCLST